MFDDPPADLEVGDDLYRVDVLCYGQAGFLDDIPDLSDERRNSHFQFSSGRSPCWLFQCISSSIRSRSRQAVEAPLGPGPRSVSIEVLIGVMPGVLAPSSSSHSHQHRRSRPMNRRSRGEPINVAVRRPLFPMTGAFIPTPCPPWREGDSSPLHFRPAHGQPLSIPPFSSLSYETSPPRRPDPFQRS